MKTLSAQNTFGRAFNVVELLVVVGVLALLTIVIGSSVSGIGRVRQKSSRIACVRNLKNIGMLHRLSATNPIVQVSEAWQGFAKLSAGAAGVNTARILICPADKRKPASGWNTLNNQNISYFLGLDADETNPQSLLAGDRNITNGTPTTNAVLTLDSTRPAGFTHELHNGQGNVVLGDGSVQQLNSARLSLHLKGMTNKTTTRIVLPE